MRTPQDRHVLLCLAVAALVGAFAAVGGRRASAEPVAAQGDFAGLIDIGGRRIYLDCRGTGSPTVVLEAGYRSSARLWSEDLRQGEAPRTAVLAGVSGFTRVCAYDRPGTVAPLKDDVRPSRSDPVPQPRTAPDAVVDLHTLLRTAGVPGPYVLGCCKGSIGLRAPPTRRRQASVSAPLGVALSARRGSQRTRGRLPREPRATRQPGPCEMDRLNAEGACRGRHLHGARLISPGRPDRKS